MAKSIEEFREDLRQLKADLYQNAENTDLRLLASYIDRLIISLDDLADRIEGVEISVEELATADEVEEVCCPCCCEEAAPKKAKAKKAPKKKAKPAKKKGRK